MITNYGDYPTGKTIYVWVQTRNAEGAPVAPLSAFEAADFVLYQNGSATERTSQSGWTITSPFDSRTGLHLLAIDTSDNTDAGFYAAGRDYMLYLIPDTETVDGVTVGEPIAIFSIDNRQLLRPATAARTLVVDASGLADANMVKAGPTGAGTAQTARDLGASVLLSTGTGTGQLDFTSGVVKANLAQILGTALTETAGQLAAAFKKFFNIATPAATMDHLILVDTVTTYTGNTVQTGDAYARLGAPAGASVSADVAAVKAVLPGALTGAGNIKADAVAVSGDATAADRLEALMDGVIVGQVNDAGATTTVFIANGFTEATDDHFNGRLITFLTGALTAQQTSITDYAGATQSFTVVAMTEAPANGDFFVIH